MIESIPGAFTWTEWVPGGPVLMPLTPLLPGAAPAGRGATTAVLGDK